MTSPPDDDPGQRRARFERLFEAHYAPVLAYALRRSDPATGVAHDVTAEVFAVAWRRLDQLPADPLPWLYGTARRVLANERRGARRRAALVDQLRVTAPSATPAREPAELLHAALARLPDRDREGLLLVAWEGLSTAQAAQVMGCTPTAMRVRLHRARRRLAAALADLQPGPPHLLPATDHPQELPA